MKFLPFPILKTERLILRRFDEADWETILFLRSDETVNKFIYRPESSKTKNKADALQFIKMINDGIESANFISWGITLKNDPKIIGTICLWNFSEDYKTAEVGYDLNPVFHGRGVMSEALNCIVNFGLHDLNLDLIEAFTHKENGSSTKLLEKNGFKHLAHRVDDENTSNIIFEIKKHG